MIDFNKPPSGADGGSGGAAPRQSGRFFHALRHPRALVAFRHPAYRLLMYGQIFVSMGQWMDDLTRGWLMYELTNSTVHLGLVRGVQVIPFLFLSPLAGSAADRYSRKTQLLTAQILSGLVFAVTALLIFTSVIRPWHVYATAFFTALAHTFLQPARGAMIADVVPPDYLTNAIGLNSLIHNSSRSIGPAVGGVLIALYGTGGAFAFQALCFFLAVIFTVQIAVAKAPPFGAGVKERRRESLGRNIIEGWKFSWRSEEVRCALFTLAVVSLFMVPFRTLLPVYARDLLQVGATGQGLMLTVMGVGALGSGAMIALVGERLPRGMLMLGFTTIYGLILLIFAASPWFRLSLLIMGIAGFCSVHSHALVQTVIQSYSPSSFRGRTMALYNMSHVVMLAGSIGIGLLSSQVGARLSVAIMGMAGVLAMIGIYLLQPGAKRIR